MVTRLADGVTLRLTRVGFSYGDVGATATVVPPGYSSFSRTRTVQGTGFASAVEQLTSWKVHERAGLRVSASSPRAVEDAVVLMRLGLGRVGPRIPCRVVYVIDEPQRAGFAYGTLPGHPEQGEELFLLEADDQGQVHFTVSAFSRPASLVARLGGPLTKWFQHRITDRYLAALDTRAHGSRRLPARGVGSDEQLP